MQAHQGTRIMAKPYDLPISQLYVFLNAIISIYYLNKELYLSNSSCVQELNNTTNAA